MLRGIGPGNPAQKNENLRAVCENIGLTNVATVISSGNIIFDTDTTDILAVEEELERAWPVRLGFESTTTIRTKEELLELVELNPFGSLTHDPETYLLVTFAKTKLVIPADRPGPESTLLGATDREFFTVTDTTKGSSLDVMTWADRAFEKRITSRTWLTVGRILKKME